MFYFAGPAALIGMWISARRKEEKANLFIKSLTNRDKDRGDEEQ